MATAYEKLAASLEALEELQNRGLVAIRSTDLSRTHRERLYKAGFLKDVIKGWYIPSRPDETVGESTAWYASFWDFCAQYLEARFGDRWSLSPEQSLLIHADNYTVPAKLFVRAEAARNKPTKLPRDTSIYEVRAIYAAGDQAEMIDGLRIFKRESALVLASKGFFRTHTADGRALLAAVPDASQILMKLLSGGHVTAAGRLAGAFRNIGRGRLADEILSAMKTAMYDVREVDPFVDDHPMTPKLKSISPHVHRSEIMWTDMRAAVIEQLPEPRPVPNDIDAYLANIDSIYVADAYHSLSIEGYKVSRVLVDRVRSGNWNTDAHEEDRRQYDALAARGYWQAFQAVKASIRKVLEGADPTKITDHELGVWHRELFAPSAAAGLIPAAQLAGYRNSKVLIRRSRHVPPSAEAVRDLMPAFFRLLEEEDNASVRVALGHFMFAFIHPFVDGNGRLARFLMNLMLSAAGLPWTVIQVEHRDRYMQSLESASVEGDIAPFAEFLGDAIRRTQEELAAS